MNFDDIKESTPDHLKWQTINNNFRRLQAQDVSKQYKDSEGVPQMFFGRDGPSGQAKFKIAQSGTDVNTATDDQLILSSDFNMLKIVDTGTLNLNTVPGGSNTVTHNHNLGYVPVGLVYTEFTTNSHSLLPYTVFGAVTGVNLDILSHYDFFLDDNDLIVQSRNGTGQPVANLAFRYYLFRETAA